MDLLRLILLFLHIFLTEIITDKSGGKFKVQRQNKSYLNSWSKVKVIEKLRKYR